MILRKKTSASVRGAMDAAWLNWAGPPVRLICDMGPEFASQEFVAWCEFHGIEPRHAAVEAPWQNSPAERGGGAFKAILRAVVSEHQLVGAAALRHAAAVVCWARNSHIDETGYSPSQWVLGRSLRLPWNLLGKGGSDVASMSIQETDAVGDFNFARRVALLRTAQLANVRLSYSARLRRALLAGERPLPQSTGFERGEMVYFYRQVKTQKGGRLALRRWRGPGIVVGLEGKSGVYIAFRGHTTKCAPEHVRRASHRERLAKVAWDTVLEGIDEQARRQPAEPADEAEDREEQEEIPQEDPPAEEIVVDLPELEDLPEQVPPAALAGPLYPEAPQARSESQRRLLDDVPASVRAALTPAAPELFQFTGGSPQAPTDVARETAPVSFSHLTLPTILRGMHIGPAVSVSIDMTPYQSRAPGVPTFDVYHYL